MVFQDPAFSAVAAFAALHGLAWGIRGPLMSAIRAALGSIVFVLARRPSPPRRKH